CRRSATAKCLCDTLASSHYRPGARTDCCHRQATLSMTHALIENALLLFSLCWLLTFNKSLWQRSACNRGKLFAGLWFGVACVIGMSRPLELAPGLIFDARSVVLSMAALFGGPLVGGLAALVAAAYRLWISGVGVFVGLGSVLLPVLFGLAYRQLWLAGHLRV